MPDDFLKDLRDYVTTELPLQTFVFTAWDTADPDRAVLIREASGQLVNFYFPNMIQAPVQFLSRGPDSDVARDDVLNILDLFKGQAGINGLATWVIDVVDVISGPASIGQDEGGRHMFTLNLLFRAQIP